MATSTFDACLRRLLAHEGGYTNHPADPGGPTNFGITLADYRRYVKAGATAADVRAMRVAEAAAIYRAQYWDALRCDALPPGVDNSVFDYGVNSGVGRSGKVLRRVLGLSDRDWRVTAEVIAALDTRDARAVINALNDERLRFLRSLRTWPVFGAGWSRRVAEVRAFSIALAAGGAMSGAAAPASGDAAGKGRIAPGAAAPSGAAAGAVVAGSAVAASRDNADPVTIAVLVLATLAAAAAAWFALRWWRARRQERAVTATAVIPETITQQEVAS